MPWGFAIGAIGTIAASSMASDASNNATDAASKSAADSAQLGQEQLDFAKQQYSDATPYRNQASDLALKSAQAQLDTQNAQNTIAADYNDYNKTTFRPLEQSIVADSQNYDTPEKRQEAANAAMSDVNSQFDASNEAQQRALAANGVNPGSSRAIAAVGGSGIERAKAAAGAAYKARQGVQTVGHAMKMDAASLGRNLPSAQTTTAQTGISAGNAAVNGAATGVNVTNSGVSNVMSGYNGAVNASLGAGQLYNNAQQIANQAASQDNAAWGALGSAAGNYLSKNYPISDKNVKTDVKPVDGEAALAAVNATPVKQWRYDPAKMAAAGLPMDDADRGPQIGPMAQDVQKNMGDAAAPGGRKLSIVTLNGINMKAVQAVDKKVNTLAKEVKSLAQMIRGGQLEARAA